MNEAYVEYAREHPEELARLNSLKRFSDYTRIERKKVAKKEVDKVEEWRRILYGKDNRL